MNFSIYKATADWALSKNVNFEKPHLHHQPETLSTNDDAKRETDLESLGAIHLYLTDHQSAGRGRGSNSWIDVNQGHTLLSSWCFGVSRPPQPVLAPAIGYAVYSSLTQTWRDAPFALKAPNDVLCEGHKIAGILIESVQVDQAARIIVGIGLNIWAKPQVSTNPPAGALCQFVSADRINLQTWNSFLNRLFLELRISVADAGEILSINQRIDICRAINQNSDLKIRVKEVRSDGGLLYEDGSSLDWQSI